MIENKKAIYSCSKPNQMLKQERIIPEMKWEIQLGAVQTLENPADVQGKRERRFPIRSRGFPKKFRVTWTGGIIT